MLLCRMLAAQVLVVALAATSLPSTDPQNQSGWVVYDPMSDEFEGCLLNESKWTTKQPWKGRQPGLFAAHNVRVSNGSLILDARASTNISAADQKLGFANYTTAAVRSVAHTFYGYFEVRSKSGSGLVSSSWWFHWNNGTEWTEIDVFESTGTMSSDPQYAKLLAHKPPIPYPQQYNSHTHVFKIDGMTSDAVAKQCECTVAPQGSLRPCSAGSTYSLPFNMSDGFHVYGLEWNAQNLTFYVDSKVVYTKTHHCMNQPIGMDFDRETMPGWFWPEHAAADLPMGSAFEVDYVRAWKKAGL